jgi:hypothetical protein
MQPDSSPFSRRALLHAKLDALLDECDLVTENAAFGQTFDDMENFFLVQGRLFLQETFQEKLQECVQRTETTDEAKQCPKCKKKTRYQDEKTKDLVCVHGDITVERCYRYCSRCKEYSFFIDVTLGLPKRYSTSVCRFATRCCGLWSYELAADTLAELCGIHLSHTTVGKIANETADEIETKMDTNPAFRESFQKAKGETEFYVDGTFVHILNADGAREWREMKVAAFAKRLLGESALPAEWATRFLPKPSSVYAFASISDKAEFQERCNMERRRLGIGGVSSALGDGAKCHILFCVGNIVREVFGKTDECLDIYHALEHVSSCGKTLYGEGESFISWLEKMRLVLLSSGFAGMERELESLLEEFQGKSKLEKFRRASVSSLLEYLRGNSGRLDYSERLSAGRAIGSGLIEGACKNLVGRRMKQTGACWRVERANKMARVCSLLYADQWNACWKKYH